MNRLSTVGNRAIAMTRAQVVALRENGLVTYVRTRPQAALGWLGSLLLTMDSLRMAPTDVHERWADRSGTYSPEFYAALGETGGTESIRSVLDARVDTDASILELGCSAGRNLAHLHEHGYENLHGIDINAESFAVMNEHYPDLAAAGTFHHGALEDVVRSFDDRTFDVVFSVETLQHIHPDNADVFEEIARVTDDLLLTKENEPDEDQLVTTNNVDGFPLYHRQWRPIFTDLGFDHVTVTRDNIDTLRVFERASVGSSDA